MITRIISVFLTLLSANSAACNNHLELRPADGMIIKADVEETELVYSISLKDEIKTNRIKFDTEKRLYLGSDDLNFDGYPDIFAWHTDEGMGSFSVYRIFIYLPKNNNFIENLPNCGDQFLNLKIDKKHKKIRSTYFEDNIPKICETFIPH